MIGLGLLAGTGVEGRILAVCILVLLVQRVVDVSGVVVMMMELLGKQLGHCRG